MSSFGSQMAKRLNELRKAGRDAKRAMAEAAEGATIEAVRVAAENTPPNGGTDIAGTNMRSGQMAQHWETDSETVPVVTGTSVRTALGNNMMYASYVNDGHRVDKHFVPGLIINGNLLERDPDGGGGIMVGTKTPYVQGKYMKQKAVGKYRQTVRTELSKRVKEAIK